MHPQVHHRAEEQQQIRQDAEEVRSVLGHEKEDGDGSKTEQGDPTAPPTTPSALRA